MTIPEERVRLALLRVEHSQLVRELAHTNAAILHLLSGGKNSYDAARREGHRQQDYSLTSDQILKDLRAQRRRLEERLSFLLSELALLEKQD
jgi:hypothetical protein